MKRIEAVLIGALVFVAFCAYVLLLDIPNRPVPPELISPEPNLLFLIPLLLPMVLILWILQAKEII